MVSRRKERQEDAKLRVMQIINQNPEITSRKIAQKIGISNGSAYYLLMSLIDNGFVKFKNFKKNSQKSRYCYILTTKGIREKYSITQKFLVRKRQEQKLLEEEIIKLERTEGLNIK